MRGEERGACARACVYVCVRAAGEGETLLQADTGFLSVCCVSILPVSLGHGQSPLTSLAPSPLIPEQSSLSSRLMLVILEAVSPLHS